MLLAKENHRVLEASLHRLERLMEENRILLKAGVADEYDVLRIEVQLANQRPLLTMASNQIEQARRELQLMLGLDPSVMFDVEGDLLAYELKGATLSSAMETPADVSAREASSNASILMIDRMSGLAPSP